MISNLKVTNTTPAVDIALRDRERRICGATGACVHHNRVPRTPDREASCNWIFSDGKRYAPAPVAGSQQDLEMSNINMRNAILLNTVFEILFQYPF
jgi:hypothetical protein